MAWRGLRVQWRWPDGATGDVLADVNVLAAAWARSGLGTERERKKIGHRGRVQGQPSGTGIICSRAGTVLAAGRLAIAIDETGMATAHESSCRPSTVSEPVVPCPCPFQPTHLRCAPTSYHRVRSASPVSHDGSEILGTSGPDQTPPANLKPNCQQSGKGKRNRSRDEAAEQEG